MGFRIHRGIFQKLNASRTAYENTFKIDEDGRIKEVDSEGNVTTGYLKVGDKATDSDLLDGINSTGFVKTDNNSTLNTDTRNTRGATRLFRNDSNSDYSVQHYWTGAHWFLRGFNGDTLHAEVRVGKADFADNADTLDGSHKHEVGNRDHTKTSFSVGGEADIYYPVLITPRGGYAFNRWSISRWYGHAAPWDPIGTGSHKGGLTFDFYWAGDTAWGGNDKSIRIHQFSEQYTTMVGGIQLARTGGMIVWLRGGNAYYELQVDTAQATVDVKLEGWTDGAGTRFDPTDDVNLHRDSIWNNYPVRNGDDLYINNRAVATERWTDDTFLRISEKAADSNLLDGINSTSFLRSDADDTMSGTLTITGSNGVSRLRIEGTTPTIDLDDADGDAFYIHVNSDQFYVLADRNNIGNYGSWETPHPLQLAANTNKAYIFGSEVKSAAFQASSAFDAAGAADAVREDLTPLITTATNTADNAASTASTANTTATNAANAAAVAQTTAEEATTLARAAQTTADSKLGSTAKAADANLLDGINSSQFLRSDAADTMGGNLTLKYNTSNASDYNALNFAPYDDAAGLNDYIIKAESSRGVFGRKSFGWHVHSSSAFGVYSNGWTKLFGVEGGTGNAFATGSFNANQLTVSGSTNSGRFYADEWGIKIGTTSGHIQFGPANTTWAHIYTDRPNFYFNKNIYVTGARLATETYASNVAGEVNNRIETEIKPLIDTVQATAEDAQTTADSALTTAQTAETRANSAKDQAAAALPLAGGTITGGITISGSLSRGTYTTASQYHTGADNIVLKGNGSGISGLFFESEKNGTNINHPSDFGFIQYHPYGTATSGESNELIIGVSNDADDHVVFNAPNANGLKFRVGSSNTDYTVWHSGNLTNNSSNWNTAFSWGNHAGLYDSAGAAAGVDARINEEILPQLDTNATNIARNATELATKLGTSGKAADSDKLDGYDWMQSGKSVRANEFYADNWFRNYNVNEGIYNEATGVHWYSDSSSRWRFRSGNTGESWIMMCTSGNDTRGSFYANSSNEVGILDRDNHWAVRVVHDSYVELRDNNEVTFRAGQGGVDGNYGTVQTHGNGKGGWAGYSIQGQYVFMSDGSDVGIYNDIDNEWMIRCHRNAGLELRHNGSIKLETTSGGATVTGTMTATAFSGDGSGLTNIPVPDPGIPATLNGEPVGAIVSVNFNLDRGLIEFTLESGEVINGAIAR